MRFWIFCIDSFRFLFLQFPLFLYFGFQCIFHPMAQAADRRRKAFGRQQTLSALEKRQSSIHFDDDGSPVGRRKSMHRSTIDAHKV